MVKCTFTQSGISHSLHYSAFMMEIESNFGPYDPVSEVQHQLYNLEIKDIQHINKYVVEFNRLASQV